MFEHYSVVQTKTQYVQISNIIDTFLTLWTLTCLYSAVPLTLADPGKIVNNWWNWGRIYNKTPSWYRP